MPRRSMPKWLRKAQERFQDSVTIFIISLGARPADFYDYVLETPAGLLHITVYADWVATRFEDVTRGTEFTKTCGRPCNPYSGKWNFHFADGTAAALVPEVVLPELDYCFDRLLHWEAVSA